MEIFSCEAPCSHRLESIHETVLVRVEDDVKDRIQRAMISADKLSEVSRLKGVFTCEYIHVLSYLVV